MVAIKSSILFGLFALSVKVIATPPACLLAAVKYDLPTLLQKFEVLTDSWVAALRRILLTWIRSAATTLLKFKK
jgi:hypothetical protein